MRADKLVILAIDDTLDNLTVLRAVLADLLPASRLVQALSGQQGLELAAAQDPDVILLDLLMPGLDGFEVCRRLKADSKLADIPVIILTALRSDRETRFHALDAGAEGFLTKPLDESELLTLVLALAKVKAASRRLATENHELEERVRSRSAVLAESEARFRAFFELSNIGKSITKLNGEVESNQAFADMLGYSIAELVGKNWREITPPEDIPAIENTVAGLVKGTEDALRFEKRFVRRDGVILTCDLSTRLIRDAQGQPLYFLTGMVDITERKQIEAHQAELQEQLHQSQKMESVGRLAGGVAHDFNNMLAVMLGNAELALSRLEAGDPLASHLTEIQSAAERSAALTKQLLAFARKQAVAPKVLELNASIEELLKMLRRLIGDGIDFQWSPGPGLWRVCIDPSQLDQVLVNLSVNAKDALGDAGTLHLSTENVTLSAEDCQGKGERAPGDYVVMTVRDTGCGFSPEVHARLFEPFFTTKPMGKGTGLGLSTVYGIVKQNNGFIEAENVVSQGAVFRVYLPRCAKQPDGRTRAVEALGASVGRKTVLVVEDEKAVLQIVAKTLEKGGHSVLMAEGPSQALQLVQAKGDDIHLMLVDVMMPEMSGRELFEAVRRTRPGMKCLFMSGYTADLFTENKMLRDGVGFIGKPFTASQLLKKLNEALGA